jgi:hypothetical protein
MDRVVRKGAAPGCTPGRLPPRAVATRQLPLTDRRRCCVCKTAYRLPSFAWRCERWHWGDNERR